MAQEAKCSLMTLPPELRNPIYEFALVTNTSIDPYHNTATTERRKVSAQPPLTRVDRTVRQEALSVFYGKNKFELCMVCSKSSPESARHWLNRIGRDNRRSLKQCYMRAPQDIAGYIKPESKIELVALLEDWEFEAKLGEFVANEHCSDDSPAWGLQKIEYL